jgi:AcrR family transcriptional regulator
MSNRVPTEERKAQILATAQQMFSHQGYHGTTMRDIAQALNMQGGSLYAHITAKEDILWEIVNRAADEFLAAALPLVDAPGPAAARLRAMLHAHVGVVARNLENATVFFHEWRFLGEDRRAALTARRDAYEACFRQVIAQGIAAGEFPHADARLGAVLVLSAGNWLYQWFRPDGTLSADDVEDPFADMIIAGLRCVENRNQQTEIRS